MQLDWPGVGKGKRHCISHRKHWEMKCTEWGIQRNNGDKCSTRINDIKYNVDMDREIAPKEYNQELELNVYTDGSKTRDKVGSGALIRHEGKTVHHISARLPDHATVFQAEITAITEAAKFIDQHTWNRTPNEVCFFVDSQSALGAINNPKISSKTVEKAVKTLNKLHTKIPSVSLTWIKAHTGHPGNEAADRLAKIGTRKDLALEVHQPHSTIQNNIRLKVYDKWKEKWDAYELAQQTKQFHTEPDKVLGKSILKLTRHELGRYVRVVTGHNNLKYHYGLMNKKEDKTCRFCKYKKETFHHLITIEVCDLTTEQILKFSNMKKIKEALEYEETNQRTPSQTQ